MTLLICSMCGSVSVCVCVINADRVKRPRSARRLVLPGEALKNGFTIIVHYTVWVKRTHPFSVWSLQHGSPVWWTHAASLTFVIRATNLRRARPWTDQTTAASVTMDIRETGPHFATVNIDTYSKFIHILQSIYSDAMVQPLCATAFTAWIHF